MKLSVVWSIVDRTLVGLAVQFVQKGWDALTKSGLLSPAQVLIQRYMWFTLQ